MQLTGAQALVRSLEHQGVDVVFGLPGGAILPAYDPLLSSSLRHVLVRHEQGAGHAAEGYAWATGRVGVCIATSGPGATNLVTALADAYMDSVPMVAITGQVPSAMIGSDAFQEADITGITLPVTKHNELVTDAERIPAAIAEAFHVASTGRPGPVLVDIPKDILQAQTSWGAWPPAMELPGYQVPGQPDEEQLRAAAVLLHRASRPVLYVGGGVIKADAHAELRQLAELARAPVTTTLMARGAFPDAHPLALGMPGMHGCYTAVAALQEADLLVALGARFDDRVTGKLADFAPDAKVVHADIDPAEIGKNRTPDVPIIGDVRAVIAGITRHLTELIAEAGPPDTGAWTAAADHWKRQFPLRYTQDPDGPLKPQHVVERLSALTGGDAVVVAGVGQHQMHAAQHFSFTKPRSLDQLRRPRHDGIRRARRDGRPGRQAGRARRRDRRRRLLPDDRAGARHLRDREAADQGADLQQRLPRHGAPVAGAVLRRALLLRRARHRDPGLRQAGRGLRLRRAALRAGRRRGRGAGQGTGRVATCRPWSTSGCTTGRASSRWCRPASPTTTSSSARSSATDEQQAATRREVRTP